jgi:glutamyl-tRNA reductase
MVDEEVRKFEQRLQTAEVVPTIVSLQQHLETLRQAELDRVRGRLGTLSPEQEMAVESLTRGIINKIMHTPITTLKSAARDPESTTVVDVVRKLFNLRTEPTLDAPAISAVPPPKPERAAVAEPESPALVKQNQK